ncbi:MAG: polysaccharide deacetylase family protein [Chloroflexota bacterium]
MNSKMRAAARYWFIAPLILLVIGLQLGLGLITVNGDSAGSLVALWEGSPPMRLSTSLPTLTPTYRPTFTPTFTPSPTRTPTPTEALPGTPTPTGTPLPPATPTATPTPTPQPTPIGDGLSLSVPILMYHYVSTPPEGADAVRRDLSVTPDQFEAHLAFLRQNGYQTVTLRDLTLALSGHVALPDRPIILTFDDGYRDNYENAFPLLRKYGDVGVFFVFTQVIDTNNVSYLTWDMVKEMHQAGMEFGSHSYRHSDLAGRDVDFLVYEILGSKEAIEERIGEPVRFFSYPSGRYDALTVQILASANFWAAVTTQWGIEQSFTGRFELLRIRVRGNDSGDDLAEKLNSF